MLSLGEAEYNAVVKVSIVALTHGSLYADVGIYMECQVESDNSTAGSLSERIGTGLRTKHFHTIFLWIQEHVQAGDLRVTKIHTSQNQQTWQRNQSQDPTLEKHCEAAGPMFT